MPATIVRTALAVAVSVPMVLALGQSPVGAHDRPAENDCTRPFGAVTSQPGPNPDCYGIDNRRGGNNRGDYHRNGRDGNGRYYDNGRYYGDNGPYGGSAPQYYPGPYGPW